MNCFTINPLLHPTLLPKIHMTLFCEWVAPKILFNFRNIYISLNKSKPENSFNIAKNQEFELIIQKFEFESETHMEQSVESNFFEKFEAIESLPILRPYFRFFFWKKKIS